MTATYRDEDGHGIEPVAVSDQILATTLTPVLDTSAYVSGDTLSGTLLTIPVAKANGGSGTIDKIVLIDKAVQSKATEIWLFDVNTVTIPAANAAWSVSDADAAHCLGVLFIAAADYAASALNSVATEKALGFRVQCASADTNVYAALVTRSTPTYGASDLVFKFLVRQD